MTASLLSRDEVVERIGALPCFPQVVLDILATIEDPEANLNVLVEHVQHDPVITARVLSRANAAAGRTQRVSAVRDVFTAISLIGMGSVREMTLLGSIGQFVESIVPDAALSAGYWQHSVAVGVCCQELALLSPDPMQADTALIAGLLHDIGQLWLLRFRPEAFGAMWRGEIDRPVGIDTAECERFGIDHGTIGAWLVEQWSLPSKLAVAVRHHHHPEGELAEPLVPLVYVAEVLSNALDLTGRPKNRVTKISGTAFRRVGLVLSNDLHPLFGRMEARSRHAIGLLA